MIKAELEKEAYLYAKNSKDVQDFECGFDIAFKSYLASAEPREKRIAELEAQIEEMKCCENCKNYNNFHRHCEFDAKHSVECHCNNYKLWEIKEK